VTTPKIVIDPTFFAEVYEQGWSLDEYVLLRSAIDHLRAMQVLAAGNIRAHTYLLCVKQQESHECIIETAASKGMSRTILGRLGRRRMSKFDDLVLEYVSEGISLQVAVIADAHNIRQGHRPLGRYGHKLTTMLQRATIEEIVDAYSELANTGRSEEWLRKLIATGIG